MRRGCSSEAAPTLVLIALLTLYGLDKIGLFQRLAEHAEVIVRVIASLVVTTVVFVILKAAYRAIRGRDS